MAENNSLFGLSSDYVDNVASFVSLYNGYEYELPD